MSAYTYRREDTTTNKLHNRDLQLAAAQEEIRHLRQRVDTLTKDRQRLYSRIWSLKQTRPQHKPRPIQPVDEGHARILAAVNEAYGRHKEAA